MAGDQDVQTEIETPDPAGVAAALDVARRWLPHFVAGRRAPEDCYAPDVSTWHNVGEWEAEIKQTPSRTRRVEAGADIHLESLRLKVFDGGFVVQATTAGVSAAGVPVRVPTCLVVTVTDGRIARFEEYADSAAATALFGGEAKDEHFSD